MTFRSIRFLFPAAIAAALASTHVAGARVVDVSDINGLIKACQEAQRGDEIIIAPGTYTLTERTRISIVKRPGPVTVRGGLGKAAETVIEGQGQDDESVNTLFDVTDSPGWTFQDFTTRDTFYHGFKFNGGSSGCSLRNVTMRNHGEAGVKGTSDPDSPAHPDHLVIENCDIGFTRSEGGTRGVVEGVDGVAVKGWIIRGCRFVNIQKNGGPAYAVFTKGNSMETVIENNRFENCFIGASFGGGGTGAAYFRDGDSAIEHRGGAIRKNVFIGCTDAAIYINKGADCDIEGNSMLDCVSHIQVRFPQSSARIAGNRVRSNSQEPLIRTRDGAVILSDELNVRE
ncbi:right-handed parallel beta-helix repeat-containing protein [Luteolibacter yonseiensis]|uniref:right-handed parallel beta-helix repeat-containing protein n=1 Tax=Luteolibacter yonseiensis TaxID=1144680 RepID=UPI001F270C4E|nr:right-handed parallel beta-helix repeat-containing protein [Luteolibacter yonseiensis]